MVSAALRVASQTIRAGEFSLELACRRVIGMQENLCQDSLGGVFLFSQLIFRHMAYLAGSS